MKRFCMTMLCCISLASVTLAVQETQINNECKQIVVYAEKVIQTTRDFDHKYGNPTLFKCTACKKETLTHGDFLGFVLMQSIAAFTEQNKFNVAKKILDEALEIFPRKTLEELILFMFNAANELPIVCIQCHGTCWARTKANTKTGKRFRVAGCQFLG